MREQKKKQVKGGLFCSRMRKARNTFRGLKCHVSGKMGGVVNIYSNSLDSNLFRGSNLRQNPTKTLFRGEFCILTKMCLEGYISKPLFMHGKTCISEWAPSVDAKKLHSN